MNMVALTRELSRQGGGGGERGGAEIKMQAVEALFARASRKNLSFESNFN